MCILDYATAYCYIVLFDGPRHAVTNNFWVIKSVTKEIKKPHNLGTSKSLVSKFVTLLHRHAYYVSTR